MIDNNNQPDISTRTIIVFFLALWAVMLLIHGACMMSIERPPSREAQTEEDQ